MSIPMKTEEEKLVDQIVHNVRFKHILTTDYTKYFSGISHEEISQEMIDEKFYTTYIQDKLRERLGFNRIVFYLTIPHKKSKWKNIGFIPPSTGTIQSTLNSLLRTPTRYVFDEITMDFFQDVLVLFERFSLRQRRFPSGHFPIAMSFESITSNGYQDLLEEREAGTKAIVLKLVMDVSETLKPAGLDIKIGPEPPLNARNAHWTGYDYPESMNFTGIITPDIAIKSFQFDHEVLFPIEVKRNLSKLVEDLKSGEANANDQSDSQKILRQCFQQMIQAKSSQLLCTDYFRSILLIIDIPKTLKESQNGILALHYRFKVVMHDDYPLTFNGLLTWIMFKTFKLRSKKEMITERKQLLKLVNWFLSSEAETISKELSANAYLLNELSAGRLTNSLTTTNISDIQMSSIRQSDHFTVGNLRYPIYKKIFKDPRMFENVDKVVLKIIDPTKLNGYMNEGLNISIANILKDLCVEVETFKRIKQINRLQNNQRRILRIPKFLTIGTVAIWNQHGVLQYVGLYIEKIDKYRKRELAQFIEIEQQGHMKLNNGHGIFDQFI